MERCYSQTKKEALTLVWKIAIADAISHLNSVKQLDCGEEYDFIRAVVESCVPVALSPKEMEEAFTVMRNCA